MGQIQGALDGCLRKVLHRAHSDPFKVASNFARTHAELVALAASKGLISTRVKRDVYSRTWKITCAGLQWLNQSEEDS